MNLDKFYKKACTSISKELSTSNLKKLILTKPKLSIGGYGHTSPIANLHHKLYLDFDKTSNSELVKIGDNSINYGIKSQLFWNNFYRVSEQKISLFKDQKFHNDIYNILLNEQYNLKKGRLLNDNFLTNFTYTDQKLRFMLNTCVRLVFN